MMQSSASRTFWRTGCDRLMGAFKKDDIFITYELVYIWQQVTGGNFAPE